MGSAQTWGDTTSEVAQRDRFRLEAELREVTDIFLGDVRQDTVAYYANAAMHHIHVAFHDTCCQNQQEAALAGATLWGLTHPINSERPVKQFRTIDALIDALCSNENPPAYTNQNVLAHARKHFSYAAVLEQFHRIVREGR